MPIVLLVLIVFLPVLLLLIRFVLGALWVLLTAIALTIKGQIEDRRMRRELADLLQNTAAPGTPKTKSEIRGPG
jgi:hypothetical protein